jgi:RNA polymerase sigma-70 factor (ECF subfamily)
LRIARNTVISHYRRRGRRREAPLENDGDAPELISDGPGLEKGVLDAERWAQIRRGLCTLSQREQDIIALKFGSGLTNRTIAPIDPFTWPPSW